MNRNRLIYSISIVVGAALLSPTTAYAHTVTKAAKEVTITEVTPVANVRKSANGKWIVSTPYPSRFGSLSSIARSVYGNAGLWPRILDANPKITNPNVIQIGQRIYVPVLKTKKKPTSVVRRSSTISRSTTRTTANWVHPLAGSHPTSSCYGQRWGTLHAGIDYPKPYGTKIRAVGSGTVKVAGNRGDGYGIQVVINHGNGVFTRYGHMSSDNAYVGQKVKTGQIIGRVGSTGHSTGNHLHFEVRSGSIWGKAINPAPWLRNRGIKTGC